MPRKKQVTQKPRRQKSYEPGSAEAIQIQRRGVFREEYRGRTLRENLRD